MGCNTSKAVTNNANDDGSTNGVGGKLLDKYLLGEVLGQGAFGVVYKCTRKDDPTKEFAVKMIDQVETSPSDIKKEIDMLRYCEHPCVIKLYDVYHEKVFVCMVLELYRGGDMIQGMMHYWKHKGMIPIPSMRYLTKQMWEAIAFVHAKECVHRDVKGDNFMMDFKDVTEPRNRLYLSDFGTVVELSRGQRLNQKCGTRNYWSPELYRLNYAHKVDNWAVGVVMYGLISGKFPFKGEDDVRHKVLSIPKRCPAEGVELISMALERKEEKRVEAKAAVSHAFLANIETAAGRLAAEDMEENFKPEVQESGANAGVRLRREELVHRLQNAATRRGGSLPFVGSCTLKLKEQTGKGFKVVDTQAQRIMSYEWWNRDKTTELSSPWMSAPQVQDMNLSPVELSDDDVKKMLLDHNISVDQFGKGKAKSFGEFVAEIRNGHTRLQLDASKHRHIVRVVDLVALRIVLGNGSSAKYLVQTSVKYPDGREREVNMMPGEKRAPFENALRSARRIVTGLGLEFTDVTFDFTSGETFEEIEESPSYPGVPTVYRKEIFTGCVNSSDPKAMARLGDAGKITAPADSQGYQKSYAWLTKADCAAKKIKVEFPQDGEFSTLVYPPIGLEVDELEQFLQTNKIDTSKWGTGTTRSLNEFSEELVKGEAVLQKCPNGQIKRVVDIVILKVSRPNGDVIMEVEETAQDSKQDLKRFPAVKRRSDEHQFLAARRLILRSLRLNECYVSINERDVKIVEEETQSTSYPGLSTLYRKRLITAELEEEAFIAD